MDRKKAIVISLSVSFVLMTILFCYFYFKENSQNSGLSQDQNENVQSLTLPISDLEDADAEEINYQHVKDAKNADEIKVAFDEYVEAQSSSDQNKEIFWNRISDNNNQPVSLDDFSEAVGIKVDDKIDTLLDKNNYSLVVCSQDNGGKSYGLILTNKLFDNYLNLYPDEVSFMKNWEKYMLRDLHAVLFPKTNFSQADLEKNLEFNDGKYRFAAIKDNISIYYEIVDDYVVVTSSESCVSKASAGLLGG